MRRLASDITGWRGLIAHGPARCGCWAAAVIVAMNGIGHWYTQRARVDDMRLRTEYLAVDVIADKGLECLP